MYIFVCVCMKVRVTLVDCLIWDHTFCSCVSHYFSTTLPHTPLTFWVTEILVIYPHLLFIPHTCTRGKVKCLYKIAWSQHLGIWATVQWIHRNCRNTGLVWYSPWASQVVYFVGRTYYPYDIAWEWGCYCMHCWCAACRVCALVSSSALLPCVHVQG